MINMAIEDEDVVKVIYDFYGKYELEKDEIARILNGEPIEEILVDRIYSVIRVAQKYIMDYDEEHDSEEELERNIPTKDEIEKILSENKNNTIQLIEKYKEQLLNNEYAEGALKDIEKIIFIIGNIEEISILYDSVKDKIAKNNRYDSNKILKNELYIGKIKKNNKKMNYILEMLEKIIKK